MVGIIIRNIYIVSKMPLQMLSPSPTLLFPASWRKTRLKKLSLDNSGACGSARSCGCGCGYGRGSRTGSLSGAGAMQDVNLRHVHGKEGREMVFCCFKKTGRWYVVLIPRIGGTEKIEFKEKTNLVLVVVVVVAATTVEVGSGVAVVVAAATVVTSVEVEVDSTVVSAAVVVGIEKGLGKLVPGSIVVVSVVVVVEPCGAVPRRGLLGTTPAGQAGASAGRADARRGPAAITSTTNARRDMAMLVLMERSCPSERANESDKGNE